MVAVMTPEPPTFGEPLLSVFVTGKPARQGSNAFLGKGRVKPDDDFLYFWRDRVARVLDRAWGRRPPLPDRAAVVIRVEFYLPKPPSIAAYKLYPITDKDLDKFLRACFDAIAVTSVNHPGAGIISNDNRIIASAATKLYAHGDDAGMRLDLWEIPPEYEKAGWVPTFTPAFTLIER